MSQRHQLRPPAQTSTAASARHSLSSSDSDRNIRPNLQPRSGDLNLAVGFQPTGSHANCIPSRQRRLNSSVADATQMAFCPLPGVENAGPNSTAATRQKKVALLFHRCSSKIIVITFLLLAAISGYWLANAAQSGREIRAVNTTASPGQSLTVALELNSQGDENAIGFSLNFNPALLSYQSSNLGNGVPAGAAFFINANAAASGRIGFALALPAEQKFQAGTRQVFTMIFNVANNASGNSTLSFGDDPARRDVADINGNSVTCNFRAGTVTFVQNNPAPVIGGLDPTNRDAGSGAFTLTVNGASFVNGASVRWQGSDRATTFVNSTRLQAAITANDVATAGTASVTVFNPAPGGGVSNAAVFTINQVQINPLPVLISLEPASRTAGSGAFTLGINGSGFLNASSVRWNGASRLTTFINANRLTIDVSANEVATPGAVVVTVFNPAPGGGLSNGLTFTITQPPNPVPSVTSLNPNSAIAGSGAFTLTLNGTNFVNGAVVRWQGNDRPTTFVSATQLQAAISANDVANSGTASIAVFNPPTNGGGGGLSNAVTFTINPPPNPAPALAGLAPNTATAGGAAFTLTVNGNNFVNGAAVRWQGSDRATTFVSSTQLQAAISASDIVNVGAASVTVFNPANVSGGGGVSNALSFTINQPANPVPVISSLNPNSANAGGAAFMLTVNGSGFIASSVVRWQGNDRATTFVSSTQLRAAILASDIIIVGTVNVTVFSPPSSGGGGGVSNAAGFAIGLPPNPEPSLTSLSPASALAGGAGLTLTVNGTNFINGAIVRWNGGDRATTFVNATQVRAVIVASDIANAGSATVTVFNPAPGGGTSNALTFTINSPPNPVPSLASLSPNNATAGSASFTLTVNGASFVNGATVRWNGADRVTTFVSATQQRAVILASDLANTGTASVTVFNPANQSGGGGVSNALTFTINPAPNPVPTLNTLNPNQATAGGAAFSLTLSGTNFVSNAIVRWNGADRPTTFIDSARVTAAISAGDLANASTASVMVFNPANQSGGGGNSNTLTFTINNPVPVLSGLSPTSAVAGGGAFTLTVNGTSFINGAAVRWNGNNRQTTFLSSTQLTAQIPASDLLIAGTASITVFHPAPGGGTSNAISFQIAAIAPTPTLTSLNPSALNAGSGAFTLTVNGTNFVANSVVRWNGADRTTTFVTATQLTARINAADVAAAGTASVTVFNPATNGGGLSNALSFTINQAPNPVPVLASLNPSSASAGGGAFILTVVGGNFIETAVVRWNGANRTTTFVSNQQLTANIPASDLTNAGSAQITVFNPPSSSGGGGASNTLTFTITPAPNPIPTLASLNPNQATAGSAAFTLTLTGANFLANSTVRWNGANRPTFFGDSTRLTAEIPASDIASSGTAQVTVFNPASSSGGGGASNALTFTINPPTGTPPVLNSLNPRIVFAGGLAFTLTVGGNNFNSSSVVRWNGADRQTSFVSATQLRASIPAADIANAGTAQITVANPGTSGGTSNALPLVIAAPLANVSAASFSGNELAAEMVVAAFGANLATGVAVATTLPLPTTLLGTSVRVVDSAGSERLAPLFFVAPSQVNYLMPLGTAIGAATVIISSGDNKVSASTISLANVAPGLFSANANGSGVAAGSVLRVRANGAQSFEPLSTPSPLGQQVAVPIDLGPESDQLFLVLYGTGFRGRSSMSAAGATIGGVSAEVLFAGAQGSLAGLDQANIRLPRVLAGRGEVDVVLMVDGRVANTVKINVR